MKNLFDKISPLKPLPTRALVSNAKIKGIKAVVFDIYGTLLVSSSGDIGSIDMLSQQAVNAFKASGIKIKKGLSAKRLGDTILSTYKSCIQADHFHSKMSGVSYPEVDIVKIWKQVFKQLQGLGYVENQSIDFKRVAISFEFLTNPVFPMPGLNDCIESIHDAGYKLGIVSNAQFFTPQLLNYFLNDRKYSSAHNVRHFDSSLCVYSYQEGVGKPSPDLYRVLVKSLKRKRIEPRNCLYIGNDMLNDIYPAKLLGFKTVLYAGDKRSLRMREEQIVIKNTKPDRVIKRLSDLSTILG